MGFTACTSHMVFHRPTIGSEIQLQRISVVVVALETTVVLGWVVSTIASAVVIATQGGLDQSLDAREALRGRLRPLGRDLPEPGTPQTSRCISAAAVRLTAAAGAG